MSPIETVRSLIRRTPRRYELEFLPAALEIVETPPSPAGRGVAMTVCAAAALALGWSFWSELDVVAVASGRIIPSERSKTVQPLEIGVVRAIHAREGWEVAAGDALVELDDTTEVAERERLRGELAAQRLDLARLEALAARDEAAFIPPSDADPGHVAANRGLLLGALAEQRSKIAGLERMEAQRRGERDTSVAAIERLESVLPILRERVEIKRYLSERETGSRMSWLELRQDLVDREHELAVQRKRLVEAEAALAAAGEECRRARGEFERTVYTDLVQTREKVASLAQEAIKAARRAEQRVLTAPVAGTVQQLKVATLGGVVTPAEALMVVVPSDNRVEVEATLSNKDVGFVERGQAVEVKVDTFNYTKYGLVRGTVLSVSRDTISENRAGDAADRSSSQAPANANGEPRDLVYSVRIGLSDARMIVDGKTVDLTPGMAVTAEIKTARRRVIDFLLDPLARYRHEGMRER